MDDASAASTAGLESKLQIANASRELFGIESVALRLGRFVVLDRIGTGGMGSVYRAYDPELDRAVALKVIRREALRADPSAQARMAREARALAKLNHPHVVSVHEVGSVDGEMFVAMELVEGQDLAQWMEHEPDVAARFLRAVDLLLQAGRGLAAAHRAGVVHRDFKPANVLLGSDGRVRVADFGLARVQHDDSGDPLFQSEGSRSVRRSGAMTTTGALVGTPAYMAPEQRRRAPCDARSDQYAFCVSAWEALFGVRPGPYDADRAELPTGSSRRAKWIARALRRGLADERDDRYPTMEALLAELERNPSKTLPRAVFGASAALALAAGGVAYQLEREGRCDDVATAPRELWTQARRERISSAFEAVDRELAVDGWPRFESNIDTYVDEWSAQASASCRAAKIEGTLDPSVHAERMACLDDHLARLDALLGVFEVPDRDLVMAAPVTSSALPPLLACLDQPRSGTESSLRVTQALARGLGVLDAGRDEEAASLLAVVADDAHEAGALLAEARARLGLAYALLDTAGSDAADVMFERSYWLALEHGDDTTAAEAARGLADDSVLARAPDAAERWARHAEVLSRRGHSGGDVRASVQSTLGQIALERGDLDDAEAHAREAVRLAVETWGPDHPRAVAVENNLTSILRMRGELTEALALAEHGYRVRVRHFGARHPLVARAASTVAAVLGYQGRHVEAVERFREALDVLTSAYGRDYRQVAAVLTDLGVSLDQIGDEAAAAASYLEAVQILERVAAPDDMLILTAKINLARSQFTNGDCDTAVPMLRRVVHELVERLPKNPRIGVAGSILGACLDRQGQYAEAEHVLGIAAETFDEGSAARGSVMVWMATVLQSKGEVERARSIIEQVLASLGDDPSGAQTRSDALARLARLDLAAGRPRDAIEHSGQALERRRGLLIDGPGLVSALAEHAEILAAAEDREHARTIAAEGVAIIRDQGLAAKLAAPVGASIQLALAEATRYSDPPGSQRAAREAAAWLVRTDSTFASDRARAEALLRPHPVAER